MYAKSTCMTFIAVLTSLPFQHDIWRKWHIYDFLEGEKNKSSTIVWTRALKFLRSFAYYAICKDFFSLRFVFCVHITPTWIVSRKPSISELFSLIICHKLTIRAPVDSTPCFVQLSSEGHLKPALIHWVSWTQWPRRPLRCEWWINLTVWLDFVTSDTLYLCACLSPWVDLRQRKTETKLFSPMLTRSCLRTFKMQGPPSNCFLNCSVSAKAQLRYIHN